MAKKEIEKGAGLLLAAVSGCEQMVELLRTAVHYCYDQKRQQKTHAQGLCRIYPDSPYLDRGHTGCSQAVYWQPNSGSIMAKRNPDGSFSVHNGLSSEKPFRFRYMRKPVC